MSANQRALLQLLMRHQKRHTFDTGIQNRQFYLQTKGCSKLINSKQPLSLTISNGGVYQVEQVLLQQSNARRGFQSTAVFRVSERKDDKDSVTSSTATNLGSSETPVAAKASEAAEASAAPTTMSQKDQLVRAVRDYGSTVVVFHVAISLASLGFFYLVVSSGIDVTSLVAKVPYIGSQISASSLAAGASTFVIAYAVHKVFAPVRISITLLAAPFIVRHLRAKGILKVKKP